MNLTSSKMLNHYYRRFWLFIVLALIVVLVAQLRSPSVFGAKVQNTSPRAGELAAATERLSFPAVFYNYNDNNGNNWQSTLVLKNSSGTNASQVQIVFIDSNGQIFTPSSIPNGNGMSSNPFTLNPHESRTIPIQNLGMPTGRYAAVVSSNLPLAGVAWVNANNGINDMYEAFNDPGASTAYTVVSRGLGGAVNANSNLAIQNLSTSPLTNITLKLYDQNGNQIGQSNAPQQVAAGAAWYPDLAQINFSSGALVVSASGPIAVVDNVTVSASNQQTVYSNRAISTGSTTVYAPFLNADSSNNASSIRIQNTSNQVATVMIVNSDGGAAQTIQIAPNGYANVPYQTGTHFNGNFAAKLTSNQPIVATVSLRDIKGTYFYEAYTQSSDNFVLPLLARNYMNIGGGQFNSVAEFYNDTTSPAQLVIRYPNFSTRNESIGPGQRLTLQIANDFSVDQGSIGSMSVSSNQPLYAWVLSSPSSGTGDVAAYNAISLTGSTGGTPTPPVTPTPAGPTNTPVPPTATATPSVTPTKGSPTPIPTAMPTPTLPAADATTVAQPGQSANLSFNDPGGGKISVQIPAGAVNSSTMLLYDDQGAPSQPTTFNFAGRTFTLTAYRNNTPQSNFTFQQPVTLTIEYTDADVAGLEEDKLFLFFYDTETNSWSEEGISVITRDTANNRIVVQIMHLTEFAMGTADHAYLPLIGR